ncbi:TetR/AcrR family transcriptional regulator C-terminal domain-containing protein [Labedaea rhizosphaerae]|uniref:TetR family transcriptional regulator n=1 Tax=Labedaea rhizosphaerae TaxID=598644 RepID=A0A4R6SHU9_LABRH|nr:TetR/AcrR family transcriptional regulator C-terminal domain-containing protein [Labedaea rhizosphaerae]TDQ01395.1 TetR family transcriptional regulator [Labedaea rhizosphaerae]
MGVTPPIWLLPEAPRRQRGLDRDGIVRAAIALGDEGGADAVTMRAVATAVGSSTPMSLYRYVHNRDGLVDLMLDAAMAEVDVPAEPGADWRADVLAVARSSWAMTGRHPWFAELVHSRPPAGPNSLRKQEFLLAVFEKAGVALPTARGFAQLVDGHVLGSALQQAEERKMWRANDFRSIDDVKAVAEQWFDAGHAATLYPRITQLFTSMMSADAVPESPDEQFELGLACLLDGIAQRI